MILSQYLMKSCKNLKGGLQEVADQLELERIGPQHQAGSDSLLTGMAFFKMREVTVQQDFKMCSIGTINIQLCSLLFLPFQRILGYKSV
jgi:hypothetical protein